jgi:hypothetical protein
MGLSQGEDLGVMMAVACTATGILIDSCVYHHRMHGSQMTKSAWFDDLEFLSRTCAWLRRAATTSGPGSAFCWICR